MDEYEGWWSEQPIRIMLRFPIPTGGPCIDDDSEANFVGDGSGYGIDHSGDSFTLMYDT